ncbi:hypothetical protein [Verrucomicrobium spinosum]|uniref:hypothetical protein n=1 Tax=Verrucomicrobium spinosum TaxID=2736 RepID=UPI000A8C3CCE|nr:hypothetical protein [Verrucomicrobium spinosum]
MKSCLPLLLATLTAASALAQDSGTYSRTIFADDFAKDGFGKRWGHYKSGSVVKDGVLQASRPRVPTTPPWTTW